MIEFFHEGDFSLSPIDDYSHWINRIIESEKFFLGDINYIFCEDDYLVKINQKHLGHNSFTDIITFDYSEGQVVSGDIFISTERVADNANIFNRTFQEELLRVMAHGILHLLGYNDKTKDQVKVMRNKEEEMIKLFHVEQN